ncbi:MAG: NifB/NifX family molybdenum-iron cluster-binding protein [Oscillospiraceae bacterium]|jgi:predicted Fe-Mo cluster-binding NifX family protein
MRIAIPLVQGKLSLHFGHCDTFAVVDVDSTEKNILNTEVFDAPSHEPGALPKWLCDMQVNLIIASGMGQRAQMLFEQYGINVMVGAQADTPQQVAESYLNGTLQIGANICDH